ncbi:MAG: hypothetical protein R8M38_08140 [Mariprofundaceae bacterium]
MNKVGRGRLGQLPLMVIARLNMSVWAGIVLFLLALLLLEWWWSPEVKPVVYSDAYEQVVLPERLLKAESYYRATVEKVLFSSDRKVAVPLAGSTKTEKKVLPSPGNSLGLKLVGVAFSGEVRVALVRGKQGVERVYEGDRVAGGSVYTIGEKHIVIQSGDGMETLYIRTPKDALLK